MINAWEQHSNADEINAARRASRTSSRNVFDAGMRYNRALASGNQAEIEATQAAYQQAWESDYRTKGGQFFGDATKGLPVWIGIPAIFGLLYLWYWVRSR